MSFYPKAGVNVERHYKDSYGSIESLISLAKNGNITAQADLGTAYSEGVENFVEKDVEKAIGWLNSAVDNGCVLPFIFTRLGALLDGKGTPHYQRRAYEMYHRAAKLGCAQSQLNLAEMYRCGVKGVVNEDIKEAFEWYKKAADESEVEASADLGGVSQLVAGTMKTMGNALGGARQQALTLLHKYYLDGDCPEGEPQPTKAVYYLTRAAELGDTEAQLTLGQIYLTGSCEQIKDVRKAKRWLGKAADSGNVMANQLLQQCRPGDDTKHDASEIRLLLSSALCGYKSGGKVSEESFKVDNKRLMGITNLIHYIEKAEASSLPSAEEPFEFDKNYSSWLHVLYNHMAAIYTIAEAAEKGAEAYEDSLKCCPSYCDSKRGLGYNLMNLMLARTVKCNQDEPIKLPPKFYEQTRNDREISKYDSWTTEELRDTAVRVLEEYLEEAPQCDKYYPNACYYLAQCVVLDKNMSEFRKYYELGQDAEEKRLPFFEPVDLPIKDWMSLAYQLFANVKQPVSCGNKSCIKKVKESDLKSCARCGKQRYCSKDCQVADWKNHKVACTTSKEPKAKKKHV